MLEAVQTECVFPFNCTTFFGVAYQINESMKYTKSYIKYFSLNMLI